MVHNYAVSICAVTNHAPLMCAMLRPLTDAAVKLAPHGVDHGPTWSVYATKDGEPCACLNKVGWREQFASLKRVTVTVARVGTSVFVLVLSCAFAIFVTSDVRSSHRRRRSISLAHASSPSRFPHQGDSPSSPVLVGVVA